MSSKIYDSLIGSFTAVKSPKPKFSPVLKFNDLIDSTKSISAHIKDLSGFSLI